MELEEVFHLQGGKVITTLSPWLLKFSGNPYGMIRSFPLNCSN